MSRPERYKITQSLLASWQRIYDAESGAWEEFMDTLNRIPKQPTEAMLDGRRFENCVNAVLDGEHIDPSHEWNKPVRQLAAYLYGSQKQVNLYREIEVNGVPLLLNGVLDYLRAGVIYDTKFSKHYYLNKYLHSPQHPMYFALVPEAREFQYLSCDGTYVYRETYRPEDTEPIEATIRRFLHFLDEHGLMELYKDKWKVRN